MADVVVRQESVEDAQSVDRVVAAAFSGDAEGTPPEVGLVRRLRAGDAWLPGLSLVAVADGSVVGHVVLSRVYVGGVPALALAPLSVEPSWQRRGVGAALVRGALAEAERAGETLVLVLGEPAYYRRFGFEPAALRGIRGPYGDGPAFQALPLSPDAPVGEAVYPREFGGG
jgi:putative acetyltransferase